MQEKFQLLKVRAFTEVINDTISFAKLYIKPIGYAILVLVVPLYVLGSFFSASSLSSAFNVGHSANMLNLKRFGASSIAGFLILMIGGMMLNVIFISSFIAVERSDTGTLDSKDIFDSLKDNLARLFKLYVLIFIIGGVICALAFIAFAALAGVSAAGPAVLLGIILFIGAMYMIVPMSLVPIIYLREGGGFDMAVSRAFYLVKQNWWWTFLMLMVGGMLGAMGGFIFTLPYTIIATMKTFTSIRSGHTGYDVTIVDRVAMMLSNFGNIITSSVTTTVLLIQYYSLVEKKDGVDLMHQIDSIGESENTSY
jgi:hypothetical protein